MQKLITMVLLVILVQVALVAIGLGADGADGGMPAVEDDAGGSDDLSYRRDVQPFVHVVKNWNTVGFLASVSALCGLLGGLVKRRPAGPWLAARRVRDVPYLGRVPVIGTYSLFNLANGLLAAAAGACAALAAGQRETVLPAAVAAFFVGFNPIGHTSAAAAETPTKPA